MSRFISKVEEAAIRTAIAERELLLARLLQSPVTVPTEKIEEQRRAVERLRAELT